MTLRYRLLPAVFLLLFFPLFLSAQTITTQPLGQSTFCIGEEVSVDFTVTGAFNPGNAMILQLSDPQGNFTSGFRNLGSVSTTASGTIVTKITTDIPSGNGYRFRVIGSNPRVDGSDNGTDLTFEVLPQIQVHIRQGAIWMLEQNFTMTGYPVSWGNETKNAASYWWNMGIGVGAVPEQTGDASPTVTYATPGEKTVRFLAYTASGCEVRQDYRVTVLPSSPIIPADAVIVRNDTTFDYAGKGTHYWICPGGTARFRREVGDCFIYVEGGGSLTAKYFTNAIIFAKSGSSCTSPSNEAWCFYEEGASLSAAEVEGSGALTKVPSLTFDYSNVPPGGCPSLAPYTVQIKPNTNSIHTAQNDNRSDAEYWVRDGGALTSTGEGNAYYVEAGGHVVVEGSHNRVYVKNGGTVDVQSGSENRIFYELQGTIVNSGADAILLPSSGITFESEVSGVAEEGVTAGGNLITISPNPAEEFAEVRVDAALGRVRSVRVYSLLGEEVGVLPSSGPTLRIDLGGYAPGPYYVKIETEKGLYVRKLMKR